MPKLLMLKQDGMQLPALGPRLPCGSTRPESNAMQCSGMAQAAHLLVRNADLGWRA